MNYQHAFHAGNFADVHKHAVLVRVLLHLLRKPAAFRVIDTHAGAGRYDLVAAEPSRSGEWRNGIKKLWDASPALEVKALEVKPQHEAVHALLAPYLEIVRALNPDGMLRWYPGSPVIVQALLRRQDRLIACELEPYSAAALRVVLHGDRRAKTLTLDGWTAIGAFVPPKERRGVVCIDPPFEDAADFERLSEAVEIGGRKWPTGIYMLWYPIKTRDAADALARRLTRLKLPKILRSEIMLGPPRADSGLIGSGLILINPPFTLEGELRTILPALGEMFGAQGVERLDWLGREL